MMSNTFILFQTFLAFQLAAGMITAYSDAEMPPFEVCPNQVFAFCGVSECWTYNDVAYCLCSVEKTDSISLTLETVQGQDVCEINESGETTAAYGGGPWVISTFYDTSVTLKPNGTKAVYTCPPGNVAAYAQCDGAFCFTGTQNSTFPYFGELQGNDIICSCPIVYNKELPFEVAGPYDATLEDGCSESVFESFCNSTGTGQPTTRLGNLDNGVVISVGGPADGSIILSHLLNDYENVTSTTDDSFRCGQYV